ncbi:MAG TPA: SMP-30/gluconolactonase/LRE family protein [Sphingomonas sp.]|nr:SMP-30/gluconolactonase/LRE family protein [Sphingomonas sp.]
MSERAFEIVAQGFEFAEAPRVDDDGAVCFSDLTGGGYYRAKAGGAIETILADRIWIGGAALDAAGGVVCGGKGGLVLAKDGVARPLLSEIDGRPIIAVNDIEADAAGGLFGGTIDFMAVFERGEPPSGGLFFHLDPDGALRVFRDDVVASNGIGFSPDGRLLYHSESTVGVWAWRLGDGGLPAGRPELFAELEDSDGLAVDAEGGVWVACWRNAELRRYRADGVLDRTITLPFPHLVSLAFGGEDMRDLYVATGGDADHPGKGGVVRLRADIPGLPTHKCRLGQE